MVGRQSDNARKAQVPAGTLDSKTKSISVKLLEETTLASTTNGTHCKAKPSASKTSLAVAAKDFIEKRSTGKSLVQTSKTKDIKRNLDKFTIERNGAAIPSDPPNDGEGDDEITIVMDALRAAHEEWSISDTARLELSQPPSNWNGPEDPPGLDMDNPILPDKLYCQPLDSDDDSEPEGGHDGTAISARSSKNKNVNNILNPRIITETASDTSSNFTGTKSEKHNTNSKASLITENTLSKNMDEILTKLNATQTEDAERDNDEDDDEEQENVNEDGYDEDEEDGEEDDDTNLEDAPTSLLQVSENVTSKDNIPRLNEPISTIQSKAEKKKRKKARRAERTKAAKAIAELESSSSIQQPNKNKNERTNSSSKSKSSTIQNNSSAKDNTCKPSDTVGKGKSRKSSNANSTTSSASTGTNNSGKKGTARNIQNKMLPPSDNNSSSGCTSVSSSAKDISSGDEDTKDTAKESGVEVEAEAEAEDLAEFLAMKRRLRDGANILNHKSLTNSLMSQVDPSFEYAPSHHADDAGSSSRTSNKKRNKDKRCDNSTDSREEHSTSRTSRNSSAKSVSGRSAEGGKRTGNKSKPGYSYGGSRVETVHLKLIPDAPKIISPSSSKPPVSKVVAPPIQAARAPPALDEERELKLNEISKEALKYAQEKNYREAISLYTEAIFLDPYESRFYANRAICYYYMEEFEMALKDADRAIKRDGTKYTNHYRRAQALEKLGRYSDAEASYKRAKELMEFDPNVQQSSKETIAQAINRVRTQALVQCSNEYLLFSSGPLLRNGFESSSNAYDIKVPSPCDSVLSSNDRPISSLLDGGSPFSRSSVTPPTASFANSFSGTFAETLKGSNLSSKEPVSKVTDTKISVAYSSNNYDVEENSKNAHGVHAIWLGNIMPTADHDILFKLFSRFGTVVFHNIFPNTKDPSQRSAYAIVEFDNPSSPEKAMVYYQGKVIDGLTACSNDNGLKIRYKPNSYGQYGHGSAFGGGVSGPSPGLSVPPTYATFTPRVECRWWRTSGCKHGARCTFIHNPESRGVDLLSSNGFR